MPNVRFPTAFIWKCHIWCKMKVINNPRFIWVCVHPLFEKSLHAFVQPSGHARAHCSKFMHCCLGLFIHFTALHTALHSSERSCLSLSWFSPQWTLALKGGGEWPCNSNRFMAACEQVSRQTILHVKTGIHTLYLQTVYHVETPPCLCVFQLADSSCFKHWHELNVHRSKRDILGAVKRIFTKLNVSCCCLA